ncbi:DUF3108 domain-containing protein, partial [Dissulfurirhabdus thermomarina]
PGTVVFRARARTLAYLDAVFPVRDLVETTVDLATGRPLLYSKFVREGWRRRPPVEVHFDPAAGLARRYQGERLARIVPVPPGVQDPLSCFLAYRTRPEATEGNFTLAVTDGKRVVTGVAVVHRRERVETPAGRFDAILVEPRMEGIGGVFRKSPGARLWVWLTDDDRRLPVKVETEVIVGRFTAELTAIHAPPGTGPATGTKGRRPAR